MRQLVFSRLNDNEDLTALVGERIYASGALGVDDIPPKPQRPYIQIAFGEAPGHDEVKDTSRSVSGFVRVYVYDDRGSFVRIDDIHRLVRETIEGLSGAVSPSGRRCTDAAFLTLGGEDVMASLDLNTRMAAYRLTGPQ